MEEYILLIAKIHLVGVITFRNRGPACHMQPNYFNNTQGVWISNEQAKNKIKYYRSDAFRWNPNVRVRIKLRCADYCFTCASKLDLSLAQAHICTKVLRSRDAFVCGFISRIEHHLIIAHINMHSQNPHWNSYRISDIESFNLIRIAKIQPIIRLLYLHTRIACVGWRTYIYIYIYMKTH